ncbi:hypothetical protein N9M92_06275 [Flavobacteriaceae bacterium]|nr:hypothetical protein [Flavobacteriaceae bacterium]RPG63650.1 MAG: hypothetical protein CBC02_010150 [Flavobacteriaceae bacterium TMED42]MDA8763809.1 hypothetical protein [Flavobacteriaceae bacterium]MDB2314992.1 hypothetical protein [Flavobacteriaceae bacterium]MDB2520943.1 hypothetical protein [Flavobacteriaceae bacterium]|tara:strand:- start:1081 stop:1551 length:471 start_codon:yes stop_codon:yes gene_type:complete
MKKTLLVLFTILSIGLNAQWKGTTSNDDQRTMMIQRHMDLYPKNDQSQLKNIFNEAATINVNGTNVTPEELADFERMHHKIFKDIKFQIGANVTSKYENGHIWTHVWAWWSAEGKKSKESATVPIHLAFKWDGMKSGEAYFFFDPTYINNEIALNQ